MKRRVIDYIRKNKLLSDEASVIVGVSGGVDSIVLLDILHHAGYRCIAAHCNFNLRGKESNEDEQFVRDFASSQGIQFLSTSFHTSEIAAQRKISIEMAARDLRYEWFEALRKQFNAEAIAVAHHANDQAETILMNITRGTGLSGLTGMQAKNGHIVRPMLGTDREAIENYAKIHSLEFRIDKSNYSTIYKRNKFRNQILPLLEEINPSVIETINELGSRMKNIEKYVDTQLAALKERIIHTEKGNIVISTDDPEFLQHQELIIFEILQEYGFKNSQIRQLNDSITASGKFFFSETHRINIDRDKLIISPRSEHEDELFEISGPGTIEAPIHLSIETLDYSNDIKVSKAKNKIHIDAEHIFFPLKLRKWRQGDQFKPFGMDQFKKLSDFFIDEKLSRTQKEEVWLLCNHDGAIIWIIGYRVDNRFKIHAGTNQIFELNI